MTSLAGAVVHHPQHCSTAAWLALALLFCSRHDEGALALHHAMPPGSPAAQVGGDWAGPVGPNTRLPTSHTVDYVRVAVSQ